MVSLLILVAIYPSLYLFLSIPALLRARAKVAQRIASWTWDVTHERALSPADLFGGKAPVGALIGLLERIR